MPDENPYVVLEVSHEVQKPSTSIGGITCTTIVVIHVLLLAYQDQVRKAGLEHLSSQVAYCVALCVGPYCMIRLAKKMNALTIPSTPKDTSI